MICYNMLSDFYFLDFVNHDLNNVVTPIHVQKFGKLLKDSRYNCEETEFLVWGFSQGFDIGYEGP